MLAEAWGREKVGWSVSEGEGTRPAKGRVVQLRVHGVSGTRPETTLAQAPIEAESATGQSLGGLSLYGPRPPFLGGRLDVLAYQWGSITAGRPIHALRLLLIPFTLINLAWWSSTPRSRWREAVTRALLLVIGLAVTELAIFILTKPILINLIGGCLITPGTTPNGIGSQVASVFGFNRSVDLEDRNVCQALDVLPFGVKAQVWLATALVLGLLLGAVRTMYGAPVRPRQLRGWLVGRSGLGNRFWTEDITKRHFWPAATNPMLLHIHLNLAAAVIVVDAMSILAPDVFFSQALVVAAAWLAILAVGAVFFTPRPRPGPVGQHDRVGWMKRLFHLLLVASWPAMLVALVGASRAEPEGPDVAAGMTDGTAEVATKTVGEFLGDRQDVFVTVSVLVMLGLLVLLLLISRCARATTLASLALLVAGTVAVGVNAVSAGVYGLARERWSANMPVALIVAICIVVTGTVVVIGVASSIGPMIDSTSDRASVLAVATAKAAARLTSELPRVLLGTLVVAALLVFASFPTFAASLGSGLGWDIGAAIGLDGGRAGFVVVLALAVPIAGAALVALDAAARLSSLPPRPRFAVVWLAFGVLVAVLLISGLVWAAVGWRRTVPLMLNLIGLAILVAPLVQLFRMLLASLRDDALRRVLGIATDVGAFWPRHMHPFAPRPYGGVVVDALEDEIESRLDGGVIVAGHSQGSVIGAVALSRRDGATTRLGFLSYGSPLASLYIALFPRVFDNRFVSKVG